MTELADEMLKPSYLSNEYMVSDKGYVLSKRNKPLKPSKNHNGYLIVNLLINNKRVGVAVHTLVARAFCNDYKEGLTVNHKDGNKENNNSNNLEWITLYDNVQHSINILNKNHTGKDNHNSKKIQMIKDDKVLMSFNCCMDAAKYLEPNLEYKKLRRIQNCISRVAIGKRKTYKGYEWKYFN